MHAVEDIGSHLQHCSLPSVEVLRPAVISASTGSGRLDDAAPAATETPRGPTHRPAAALVIHRILSGGGGGRPEHQSGGRSGRVGSDMADSRSVDQTGGRNNNAYCMGIIHSFIHSSSSSHRTCKNATGTAELGGASRGGCSRPHSRQSEAFVEQLVAQPAQPPTALSPTPT
jgi:hypothetical protein